MSRGDPRLPPADLAERDLRPHFITLSGSYWRICHPEAPELDWSASDGARFSSPALPCRVLYLSESKATAFWECFGEDLLDQLPDVRALPRRLLAERTWKTVNVTPSLEVLDLTDSATLRTLGADAATFLAPYVITQRWAGALMAHPAQIGGLAYASRLDTPGRCAALFERPKSALGLSVTPSPPGLINDPVVLGILANAGISLL